MKKSLAFFFIVFSCSSVQLWSQSSNITLRFGPTFNKSIIEEDSDGYFYDFNDFAGWEVRNFNVEFTFEKSVSDRFSIMAGVNFLNIEAIIFNDYVPNTVGFIGGSSSDSYQYFSFLFRPIYNLRITPSFSMGLGGQAHINVLNEGNLILGESRTCLSAGEVPYASCRNRITLPEDGNVNPLSLGTGLFANLRWNIFEYVNIELWSSIDWRLNTNDGFILSKEIVSQSNGAVMDTNTGRVRPSLSNSAFGVGIGYAF